MQSESNPAFRKRLLKALAALGIFAFLLWWVLYNLFFDKRLFHIDSEQVTAVRLSVTHYYEEFITDREGIEEMVDLLNGFTYRRMDAAYGQFAGAGGPGIGIYQENGENIGFIFNPNAVRFSWEGVQVAYYGPDGYFQEQIDYLSERVGRDVALKDRPREN